MSAENGGCRACGDVAGARLVDGPREWGEGYTIMRRVTFGMLSAFALLLTVSASEGTDAVQAQASGDDLIPVCVQWFESPVLVEYFTQSQIDEIETTWAAYDYSDIPPPQIMGYPDPATESCATENGALKDYDPAFSTPICVPSGSERDGPLVPQFESNHYLRGYQDVILADPVTGACPQQEVNDDGTYDLLILVRNCEDAPSDPFSQMQEGCAPGVGAFFNVYSDSGEFLGNCEAGSTDPSTSIVAGCIVKVPYGSTGRVNEDLASIPNFLPGANPVSFTAPDSGPIVVEEVYGGPVFINVRQAGSIPTDLPNTGTGPASTGADGILLVTALGAVAALLAIAGLRFRHQA